MTTVVLAVTDTKHMLIVSLLSVSPVRVAASASSPRSTFVDGRAAGEQRARPDRRGEQHWTRFAPGGFAAFGAVSYTP
jgi:hypothetical protein